VDMGGGRLTFEFVVDGNRLLSNRISDIELNGPNPNRRGRSVRIPDHVCDEKTGLDGSG
jgi:hypothetical protein